MHVRLAQLVRFVIVGLFATGLQYAILICSVEALDLPAPIGSGLGFAVSAIANYALNYRFTFRSTRAHSAAVWRFVVIAAVGLLLNYALMLLFAEHWHVPYLLAQILVTGITLIWNFCGNGFWTFRASRLAAGQLRREGT